MNKEMNNKPVAWMNESNCMGGIELDVITDEFKQSGKGGDCFEYHIPLYTHPVKELTLSDEEIMDIKTLMEINYGCVPPLEFAWAILRKAQEK